MDLNGPNPEYGSGTGISELKFIGAIATIIIAILLFDKFIWGPLIYGN